MQELINSIVRLSAAATMYSMQQLQSSVGGLDSTKESVESLKALIDTMANALTAKLDESRRSTVDSIANAGNEMVGRTFTAINVDVTKVEEAASAASGMVRRTTDTLSSLIRTGKVAEPPVATEPVAVAA